MNLVCRTSKVREKTDLGALERTQAQPGDWGRLSSCFSHIKEIREKTDFRGRERVYEIPIFCWSDPDISFQLSGRSRDIPILALNHDFPISCGGVPILEDAGIFRARRFRFVLFSPVFPNPPRILHLPPVKALRCRYK